MPDVGKAVIELEEQFDVGLASTSNVIHLHQGNDEEYDAAATRKHEAESALNNVLMAEKAKIKCPKLKFTGSGKEPYLFEMPVDVPLSHVPAHYQLQSQTKACRRYTTPQLHHELQLLADAQDRLEAARRRASARLCALFDRLFSFLFVCFFVYDFC